jgi:hypothetical protein
MFLKFTQIDLELKIESKTFDKQSQLAMHFSELLDIQVFFWIFFLHFFI